MKNFTSSVVLLVLLYIATSGNSFACFCAGNYKDYWTVVSPSTKNVMVRFEKVVQEDESNFVHGKFIVLENYNTTGYEVNDAITLVGDKTSCGANIQNMSAGDSLIVALQNNLFLEAFCTSNFIGVWKGKVGNLSLEEAKAKIMILTSSPKDLAVPSPTATVFPNPANETVTVSFQNPRQETVELFLYDALARLVLRQQNSGTVFTLPLTDQPAGVYYYKLRKGQQDAGTGRIIKL